MLRYLFLLSFIFSLNAYSDVFLSSPKIKLNAQNQRVIEFRIENERINDGDITLNEYKTNNPIDESFIEYTLINDFGNYHIFTIVLDDGYLEDYFSFKILIKENFAKDIFIYLPSKVRSSFKIQNHINLKEFHLKQHFRYLRIKMRFQKNLKKSILTFL